MINRPPPCLGFTTCSFWQSLSVGHPASWQVSSPAAELLLLQCKRKHSCSPWRETFGFWWSLWVKPHSTKPFFIPRKATRLHVCREIDKCRKLSFSTEFLKNLNMHRSARMEYLLISWHWRSTSASRERGLVIKPESSAWVYRQTHVGHIHSKVSVVLRQLLWAAQTAVKYVF